MTADGRKGMMEMSVTIRSPTMQKNHERHRQWIGDVALPRVRDEVVKQMKLHSQTEGYEFDPYDHDNGTFRKTGWDEKQEHRKKNVVEVEVWTRLD